MLRIPHFGQPLTARNELDIKSSLLVSVWPHLRLAFFKNEESGPQALSDFKKNLNDILVYVHLRWRDVHHVLCDPWHFTKSCLSDFAQPLCFTQAGLSVLDCHEALPLQPNGQYDSVQV